jgi:hypothetical protein
VTVGKHTTGVRCLGFESATFLLPKKEALVVGLSGERRVKLNARAAGLPGSNRTKEIAQEKCVTSKDIGRRVHFKNSDLGISL